MQVIGGEEEPEVKCPESVPEDRGTWCTNKFKEYDCDDQDKDMKEQEKTSYNTFMDLLYKMDCIFSYNLTDELTNEIVSVEEKLELNRWTIR